MSGLIGNERIDKFTSDIAVLVMAKKKSFSPDCMKRFMFSVLKAGAESDTPAIGKGLSIFIGQLLFNVYDFEDIDPREFELNDAHWEIMSRRYVQTEEVAAQAMSGLEMAKVIARNGDKISFEVSAGVIIAAMSLTDIMVEELQGGNVYDC